MDFQAELAQTMGWVPGDLSGLRELIDPEWIERALQTIGKASIRRRKLPAEHVVWLVIRLALFRNLAIWHVVHQLELSLDDAPLCAPSAAIQGRQRLGDEPLKQLFKQLTRSWATPHASTLPELHGLALLAVDHVVWSAPDTPENWHELGSCANQHREGSWPQVRAVCLVDTSSHGEFVLRSKHPALVRQGIGGAFIAYTLLRRQMRAMAQRLKVSPLRMGIHATSLAVIDLPRFAPRESAGTLPNRLALFFKQAHLFLLPPRRPLRSFPRVVKSRAPKYPQKKALCALISDKLTW